MAVSPARAAAFEILLKVEREQSYAGELLHSARFAKLSSADHRLATELAMGVLRWRSLLDLRLASVSSQKLESTRRRSAGGIASRHLSAAIPLADTRARGHLRECGARESGKKGIARRPSRMQCSAKSQGFRALKRPHEVLPRKKCSPQFTVPVT